jgi:hypothetical protein
LNLNGLVAFTIEFQSPLSDRYAPRNHICRGPWHYLHRCRRRRDGRLPDRELTSPVQPRAMVSEAGNETRAIALSSGLGRSALVFDDDDVVHLLRAAVEREGSQIAFAKHYGINRTYLNMVLSGKRPVGDAGSWASQNIRRRVTEAVRRSVRCLVQIGRVPCRGYWSSPK